GGGCAFNGVHRAANPGADNCLTPTGATTGINVQTGATCTETDATPDTFGDILVVSAFTGGGVTPNITAYEWMGNKGRGPKAGLCVTSACSVLQLINPPTPGCDPNITQDTACAITNQPQLYTTCPTGTPTPPCVAGNSPEPVASPWLFTEKSSDNTNTGVNAC